MKWQSISFLANFQENKHWLYDVKAFQISIADNLWLQMLSNNTHLSTLGYSTWRPKIAIFNYDQTAIKWLDHELKTKCRMGGYLFFSFYSMAVEVGISDKNDESFQ